MSKDRFITAHLTLEIEGREMEATIEMDWRQARDKNNLYDPTLQLLKKVLGQAYWHLVRDPDGPRALGADYPVVRGDKRG